MAQTQPLDRVLSRAQASSHLAEIPSTDKFVKISDDIAAFKYWLRYFSELKQPSERTFKQWVNHQISFIDELINEQLNEIIHEKNFQDLECAWRGLLDLVDSAASSDNVKIKFLDVSWKDLSRDMDRSPDFDQSALFHLVYNNEFGTPGGEPFSILLGNYYVSHRPFPGHAYDDVFTLQGVSRAAAAAFALFYMCGSPAAIWLG